jgi:hypothetical protein
MTINETLPVDLIDQASEIIGDDIFKYKKLVDILNVAYDYGQRVGYEAGSERIKDLFNQIYLTGVDAGVVIGKEKGLAEGLREGKVEGEKIGYDAGFADGYQKGRDAGISEAIEIINTSKLSINKDS